MKSLHEIEEEKRWKVKHWRSDAPLFFIVTVGVVVTSAYLQWVGSTFLLLNMLAGIFLFVCWTAEFRKQSINLVFVLATLTLALIACFVVNQPPPGKIFRSRERVSCIFRRRLERLA